MYERKTYLAGPRRTGAPGRILLALLALAIVAGVVAGCGTTSGDSNSSASTGDGGESADGKYIAAFFPNSESYRFTQIDGPTFQKSVEELCPSCKVTVDNANGSATTQQAQVEAAITQGASALVIDPFDGAAIGGVANSAAQQGIPVINYDSAIVNAPVSYYLSFDGIQVGEQIAQSLVDEMKRRGEETKCVIAIRGDPTDQNEVAFWEGSQKVFNKEETNLCFNTTTPGWSTEGAQTETDQALTKIGKDELGGVYVQSDEMAEGVVASLTGAGFKKFPPVTGQNGDPPAVKLILEEKMYMTAWKNTVELAEAAAKLAIELAEGKEPPSETEVDYGGGKVPATLLESIEVTKDNVAETEVASGFLSPAILEKEVCTGPVAKVCAENGIK